MNIEPWLVRLKASCPSVQNRVFAAVELANTEPAALQTPCVFVVPLSETASNKSTVSGQPVTVQVAIVSVVKNVSDARGGAAYNALDAVRLEVKAALTGFHDAGMVSRAVYLGGSLNYFDDLIVSWVDRFEFAYFLENTGKVKHD
jgi:hypothetical protein